MDTKALSVVFGDSDLEWSRALRSELRSEGALVSAATSTHEVLALAARHAPDVIVVDEGLEKMGRDLLVRLLRHQVPGARIILILPENVSIEEEDRRRLGLRGTFSRPVTLLDLSAAIRAAERDRGPEVPSPKPALIMCVDDDPFHLKSLMRMLRHHGYSVAGFEDPERALEAIPVSKPDLVFLDVLMPGMNGLDLAEEIREQFADAIPLILLTARASDLEIADGYRRGATHYITKPCDPRAILAAADYLLGGRDGAGSIEEEAREAHGGGTPGISTERNPADPPRVLGRRHVVVCVDDEPQILSSLRRLLRNEPYEVLTTEHPQQVLDWVEKKDVSLLISDQRMPRMQGMQLMEEVFRRSPLTARILLTGYPGSTVRIQGLTQGLQLLLYKPWDDGALKRTILRMLHDREVRESSQGGPKDSPGGTRPRGSA